MNTLMLILLVIILVLLAALLAAVFYLSGRQALGSRDLFLKSQESIKASASHDQKIAQDFDILLNQIQTLARSQSASAQALDFVSSQVEAMSAVMNNAKSRGSFGEYQLEALLENYLGENPEIFQRQYLLANGKMADIALMLPGTSQVLCIDAKFPMENYRRMLQNPEDAEFYEKHLKANIKKHIDDVAKKYITPQTVNHALLFVGSEAIYHYLCSQGSDLLEYALSHHVLLCSPTTLAGIVFSLLAGTRDFYRASNLQEIEKSLFALKEDLERLETRLDKAVRGVESASSALQLAKTSAGSLARNYSRILEGKEHPYDYNP